MKRERSAFSRGLERSMPLLYRSHGNHWRNDGAWILAVATCALFAVVVFVSAYMAGTALR